MPAQVVRFIGQANAIMLKFGDCTETGECLAGTLSRYTNKQQSPIAENVLSISAQPSGGEFVAGKPDFSVPEGAPCPAKSRNGAQAGIRILNQPMTCADAQRIYSEYTHSTLPPEGNSGLITTKEWSCAAPTAGESSRTGRISTCEQPDVPQGWSFIVVQAR